MIPRLWVISPDDGRDLAAGIARFGARGVRGLVLRESRPVATDVARARAAGFSHVFAHQRAPDAAVSGADGVHVPDGAPPPPGAWGRSAHSPAAARGALAAGAAYAWLSPCWTPTSKPEDRRPPLGIAGLLAAGTGPVLALGGVDAARLTALLAAGGYGAAVLGHWWDDPDAIATLVAAAQPP